MLPTGSKPRAKWRPWAWLSMIRLSQSTNSSLTLLLLLWSWRKVSVEGATPTGNIKQILIGCMVMCRFQHAEPLQRSVVAVKQSGEVGAMILWTMDMLKLLYVAASCFFRVLYFVLMFCLGLGMRATLLQEKIMYCLTSQMAGKHHIWFKMSCPAANTHPP